MDFFSPGKLASEFERLSETLESLLMLIPKLKTSCVQGLQLPGDTIYLPFGCYHCVLTPAQDNQWTSLLSVSTFINPQQQEKAWKAKIQGRVQQRKTTANSPCRRACSFSVCKLQNLSYFSHPVLTGWSKNLFGCWALTAC